MSAAPAILWIELDQFYAEASSEPIVIFRGDQVLDANAAARARGVHGSLSLRQAKAVLHNGIFKPWEREEYEKRHRAWLDLCVDYSGVIEPDDQHTAWLDLSLHPNSVDVAEQLVRTLAQKTKLRVINGIAPSKWLAYLAAKHSDGGLAMRDPQAFLAPLPTTELLPISPEQRERLRFLGYNTIGEVAKLALPILQAQFEEAAFIIHSAALGCLSQRPHASYPATSIAESVVFDGAVETTEVIFEACRRLASSVGERLSAQGVQSGKLRIRLEYEDGTRQALKRTFTKPLRCFRSVLAAIKLLLEPALTAPVAAIRMYVPDLEKVRLSQPTLFSVANDEQLRVSAALQQVQNVFGNGAIQLGGQLEVPRRVRVLREWKHATGWQ